MNASFAGIDFVIIVYIGKNLPDTTKSTATNILMRQEKKQAGS